MILPRNRNGDIESNINAKWLFRGDVLTSEKCPGMLTCSKRSKNEYSMGLIYTVH